MVGITTSPASRQRATRAGLGAWAKLATVTPAPIMSVDPGLDVVGVGPQVHPERAVGAPAHLAEGPGELVERSWSPRPGCPARPAAAVAATSRGPATQPMPVWTTGYRTPVSSQSAVRRAG